MTAWCLHRTVGPHPEPPCRGQIDAIRLDPVVEFVDLLLAPADGSFTITRIALY